MKPCYTNHALRSIVPTAMLEQGSAPADVAKITGHRSLLSVEKYNKGDNRARALHLQQVGGVEMSENCGYLEYWKEPWITKNFLLKKIN